MNLVFTNSSASPAEVELQLTLAVHVMGSYKDFFLENLKEGWKKLRYDVTTLTCVIYAFSKLFLQYTSYNISCVIYIYILIHCDIYTKHKYFFIHFVCRHFVKNVFFLSPTLIVLSARNCADAECHMICASAGVEPASIARAVPHWGKVFHFKCYFCKDHLRRM